MDRPGVADAVDDDRRPCGHTSGTDLQLRAYEDALEPKWLALLDGDHFDPCLKQLTVAVQAAGYWFYAYLKP